MTIREPRKREFGLTFTDVVLILLVLSVFAVLLLRPGNDFSEKRKRIDCISNIKKAAVAFLIWTSDHERKFPWQLPVIQGGTKDYLAAGQVFGHFLVASNEFETPKILACPSDFKRPPTTNWTTFSDAHLSYFVGLDADTAIPESILLGDRNISTNGSLLRGLLSIPANQQITWAPELHQGYGNIALMDGSAQQLSRGAFSNAFRVLIP